jgi:hypothetical protein
VQPDLAYIPTTPDCIGLGFFYGMNSKIIFFFLFTTAAAGWIAWAAHIVNSINGPRLAELRQETPAVTVE